MRYSWPSGHFAMQESAEEEVELEEDVGTQRHCVPTHSGCVSRIHIMVRGPHGSELETEAEEEDALVCANAVAASVISTAVRTPKEKEDFIGVGEVYNTKTRKRGKCYQKIPQY